jgi:Tfp pilus assembly protein PilN
MKNIDFLPSRYHENDARRQAMLWRWILLLSFGGVIGTATLGQLAIKQSVQSELDKLQAQHHKAAETKERVAVLEKELTQVEEVAELYIYLRHPWPRTQLLAQVTRDVPESVVISELEISQRGDNNGGNQPRATPPAATNEAADISPAKRDLQGLRGANDKKPTFIHITGTATDPAALNAFVARLGESPLLKSARLTSLEAVRPLDEAAPGGSDAKAVSRFEVVITVLPGYGAPGGPATLLAQPEQLAKRSGGTQP